MNPRPILPLFIFFLILTGCQNKSAIPDKPEFPNGTLISNKQENQAFSQYWYNGQAEINSYDLRQSRYGEIRKGDAVLVFVTEDFSKEKQVKLDNGPAAGADKLSVLKLNKLTKFKTGIYDYATMQSVFTPANTKTRPNTLKTTFSSQDWCGQSFMQLNRRKEQYQVSQFSYFEKEGDDSFSVKPDLLEDEIWNLIRLNPQNLPTGEWNVLPSSSHVRLQHKALQPRPATLTLQPSENNCTTYEIKYNQSERLLSITFENSFPHRIMEWTEQNQNQPATTAKLRQSLKSAYWVKNGNDDSYMRDSLKMLW